MALALLPEFTYKRGQLYLQEIACLNLLSSANLCFDRQFSLTFESRKDSRDQRPLSYRGRVVTGHMEEKPEWLWRTSQIIRDGRTSPAEQLAATNMQRIEDPDPIAMPSITEAVCGARKFEQIGPNAFLKMMESTLDNINFEGKAGVLVCDLSLQVGDGFTAWIQKRTSLSVPTGFFGLTDDGVTQGWFQATKKEEIAQQHLQGKVNIPGYQPVSVEVPKDQVPGKPEPPKLHVLLGSGPDRLHPKFPDNLVKDRVHGQKTRWWG